MELKYAGSNPALITKVSLIFKNMKKVITIVILLLLGIVVGSTLEHNICPDKIVEVVKTDTLVIRDTVLIYKPINKENVLSELIRQEVPHADIVLAQSLLETGHYTSRLSKTHNNIFGMRTSKGYKKYKDYSECISDYKKRISSRLRKGENYYVFLNRIGYAEDPTYTSKLKNFI